MSPPARTGRGHPRSCGVSGGSCGFGAPHFWVPPRGAAGLGFVLGVGSAQFASHPGTPGAAGAVTRGWRGCGFPPVGEMELIIAGSNEHL